MCDEPSAEVCVIKHVVRFLDGVKRGPDGKWYARCPAHDDHKQSLSVSLGTRGQRIVWQCHRKPPCEPLAVKQAMLRRGIDPKCIRWTGVSHTDRSPDRMSDLFAAEIDKLLTEQPNPVEFMIRVAMLRWGVDSRTAADRAGISQATYYRHRARLKG